MSSRTADLGTQITETLKERATSGADELRETATDEKGRKGLIIGAVIALIGLVIVRRLLG